MNVDDSGRIVLDKVKYVEADQDVSKYFVRTGDVIFNNTNSEELVGKTAHWDREGEFVLSNHMTIIRVANPETVDSFYLARLLHKLWFDGFYVHICRRHVNQASVSLERLKQILIPVPPVVEQRRIARVLSTIQRAIEAQDKVIAAARELKRSLMKHLFTYGPVPITEASRVRLKETEVGPVPTHWKVVRVGEVCGFLQYGTSNRCNVDQSGLPVLRIPNVVEGRVDTSDMKFIHLERRQADRILLKPGDLLFVRTNATRENVGRCAVFRGEPVGALFASYLIRVQLRDGTIIPDFMHMYAMTESGRRYLSGMASGAADGKFNINTQTIRAVIVPYPPSGEQRQVVNMVQAVDAKIDAEEGRKAALQALFKTMLHHLMTGKIRVPKTVTSEE
jgi:type I restriction enzyme S subunit